MNQIATARFDQIRIFNKNADLFVIFFVCMDFSNVVIDLLSSYATEQNFVQCIRVAWTLQIGAVLLLASPISLPVTIFDV